MTMRIMLVLLGGVSLSIVQSNGDEAFDGGEIRREMAEIVERVAPLAHLDFESWKRESEQADLLIGRIDYSEPRPEFTDVISSLRNRLNDLLLSGFRLAVNRGDAEEAGKIFTQFGPCGMKVRLAGVLGECEDMAFLAQIVHADLSSENWSAQSREDRFRGGGRYKATGTLKPLYYKVLGEEPDSAVSHPFDELVKDETLRPYRLRLEAKYPFLVGATAQDRPMPSEAKDHQPAQPDTLPVRPSDPSNMPAAPKSGSSPIWPVVAGGAVLLVLLVWVIGRAFRGRQ
jgi:hypothetical protein